MRVALIGHSQVFPIDDYDDVEFITVRVSGALIQNAYGGDIRECIETEPDAIFVWLGGNDLRHHSAGNTVNQLMELVGFLETFTNNIYLLSVEYRLYPTATETERYLARAKAVNRSLTRLAGGTGRFRTINIGSEVMAADSPDDIHFGPNGQQWTLNKIQTAIAHAIADGRL